MSGLVHIKTFGCQMNERDSEIMEYLLSQAGYVPTGIMEEADLVILNTCSIRAKAEQKVFSLLGHLRQLKKKKETGNKPLFIGVAGCVAQQEGEQIINRMPHVDIVVGTQQFYHLPDMLGRLQRGESSREIAIDLSSSFHIPALQEMTPSPAPDQFRKFVTIMQGCNNYCSYCVVPETRGREISRPVKDILEEVEKLVSAGVREITLLGQNVNSYGRTNPVDSQNVTFSDLLRLVARTPGLERLRFTTSNPKDLSRELMSCFAEIDILCPQFHLPVQSGSNRILARMNRKYTRELYLERVANLRSFRPDIALTTDVIVGFPGESEADFAQTVDLLREVRYHGSFSFKYSDRPGTRSSDFDDKVSEEVKKERLARFQELQDQISLERNTEYVGKTMDIMVESVAGEGVQGRTTTNHIVHCPPCAGIRPGDIVPIRVIQAGKHSLKGEYTGPEKEPGVQK
ncbi:tRNA (N6-isopentenyl adenosine(37)-C2)-methylthiotransferase MiaB [Desulfolithobacter sp.]